LKTLIHYSKKRQKPENDNPYSIVKEHI